MMRKIRGCSNRSQRLVFGPGVNISPCGASKVRRYRPAVHGTRPPSVFPEPFRCKAVRICTHGGQPPQSCANIGKNDRQSRSLPETGPDFNVHGDGGPAHLMFWDEMLTSGPKTNPWHACPETRTSAIPMYKQGIVFSGIDIAGKYWMLHTPAVRFFISICPQKTAGSG